MDPGEILSTYGLAAVFLVLLVKEAGLPVPIPGDLIMLLAGIRAAQGQLVLWQVLLVLLIANLIGASLQFLLVRGPGRGAVYRVGRYVGLPPARLDRAAGGLQSRGARAVTVARITPGVRAAAAIAAGLAGLSYGTFLTGLTIGSLLWILFHTLLGFFAGPWVLAALQSVHLPLIPLVAGLLLLGIVVWLTLGFARSRSRRSAGVEERLRAWTEAGCPVCLAIGALTGDEV